MNVVNLIGNLTRDPDTRRNGEMTIARFTVAVSRKRDETDYIGCVAFGKTAETVEKYCHKGKKIGIEGRIQTGSYEREGRRIYTTDVVVNRLELLSSAEKPVEKKEEAPSGFDAIEEDIPF